MPRNPQWENDHVVIELNAIMTVDPISPTPNTCPANPMSL